MRPDARGEMQQLARFVRRHPASPMSLFGHADPVGKDNYNKILSGRSAAAVYVMLTRDAAIWEDLFSNTGWFALPAAGDRWVTRRCRRCSPRSARPSRLARG